MSELFRCLACQGSTGTSVTVGTENWYWKQLDASGRHAGPFCTQTCADGWTLWPEEVRLASIFGDAGRAAMTLQRFDDGHFVQDMPAIGAPLWRLDFNLTVLLDEGAPFASLPHSKCPNPTHNTRNFGDPNYCLDCGFTRPTGWRQVVAR